MADRWRRWRRPLITGVGIWLLSFPLLTWHPAAASHPAHVANLAAWETEAADHRLVRQQAQEARTALEAAQALAAATTAAGPAAATAANPPAQTAPALQPAPASLAVRANTIV